MSPSAVVMIRPAAFGYNAETAESNVFQSKSALAKETIAAQARTEVDVMVEILRTEGVTVHCFEDSSFPIKPDAVFPNNWFSIHGSTLVLYPMMAPSRRLERSEEFIKVLQQRFELRTILDLRKYEEAGKYVEGTGSLVFDEQNKLVYASVSPRTEPELVRLLANKFNYAPVLFSSVAHSKQVYHTNVVMTLGDKFGIVCFDCINEGADEVKEKLVASAKEVIEITIPQMENFCGNCLELKNKNGEKLLVMSERAYGSFEKKQLDSIEKFARIIPIPLSVIESVGGGSTRCMMAGVGA